MKVCRMKTHVIKRFIRTISKKPFNDSAELQEAILIIRWWEAGTELWYLEFKLV